MNSKIAPTKEPQILFLLTLVAFLEIFFSGVITLLIHPDPKNSWIFGYSVLRLFLVAWIWILAITVLVTGIIARKNKLSLDSAWLVNKKKNLRQCFYAISFALIVWGWLSLFSPPYLFGRFSYIFERVQPISIALGVVLAQSWLVYLFVRYWHGFCALSKSIVHKYYRPTLLFAIVMTGLGIFIAYTKFGLVSNLAFYNVPGIPLSSIQLFFILLLTGFWIAFVPDQENEHTFIKYVKKYRLIPILIFLIAVLVWGLTPMNRHFFSLRPAAPSYQPFPFSDAREHDIGGISILRGFGVFYAGIPDKTLYFVFMAILHFFAGYNYLIMIWLQILILAFIPVILFLLGEKFHSTAFGIFLSLVLIIRQRNSIVLSAKISTVNPKLFITEEMTLLGVTLFAYLLFVWIRDRKIWLALLCGGCIGATSLFRLNPLFLFPAGACLVVPAFWKLGKKFLFSHLTAYTLAFLILLVPWIITGINPGGRPFLLNKLFQAYNKRYGSIDNSIQVTRQSSLPEMRIAALKWEETAVLVHQSGAFQELTAIDYGMSALSQNTAGMLVNGINDSGGIIYRFLDHFLHNFSTSVLSMPDSFIFDNLNHLSQRVYWSDPGGWHGDLPVSQTMLVFLNLFLIAIGLGYSWINHRWAGMIPMTIFIAYSLSLAAAMSSGGRYLVPMDWVVYFYYGLAIVVIIRFSYRVLTGRDQGQPTSVDSGAIRRISDRWSLGFSLAGIVCLASLIPIANFALPAVSASTRNWVDVELIKESIAAQENPGVSIVNGLILYPYDTDDTLTFDYLTSQTSTSYTIFSPPEFKINLKGGEDAFIVLRDDDNGDSQLESIYLWKDAKLSLVWKFQP